MLSTSDHSRPALTEKSTYCQNQQLRNINDKAPAMRGFGFNLG